MRVFLNKSRLPYLLILAIIYYPKLKYDTIENQKNIHIDLKK